jgi:hypothetical protein
MNSKFLAIVLTSIVIATAIIFALPARYHPNFITEIRQKMHNKKTIKDVIEQIGPEAEARLRPYFKKAGVPWPGQEIDLLAIKDSQTLELWATQNGKKVFIRSYPIQALSGYNGPKLLEGDRQVPEGIYHIVGLNPNSRFHLSMKLNYPNETDLTHAEEEGRDEPGSDIFIHGKDQSIGCLAMGDQTIEELFVLAAQVGVENVNVLIAPQDPRTNELEAPYNSPAWVNDLYEQLTRAFKDYSLP